MFNSISLLGNLYGSVSPLLAATSLSTSSSAEGSLAFFEIVWVIALAITILTVAALWKIYIKAGKPGWAAIVPIYSIIVLLKIVKKPTWWIFLYFIPIVNIVISIIVVNGLSKAFGKDVGYTFGLVILPFIFYPMLAFGDATYIQTQDPPIPAI